MLRGDRGRDRRNFRLAEMLAGPHERLQRHPSIGFAVARHGVGEPQRCALAIRVQRAGLVAHEGPQRIHRQLGFTPEMTAALDAPTAATALRDRKSTRLNSSHLVISYAVFCLKKKKTLI